MIARLEALRGETDRLSEVNAEVGVMTSQLRDAGVDSMTRLPSISREMRLILAQIPGLREAMTLYSRGAMMTHGVPLLSAVLVAVYVVKQLLAELDRRRADLEAYRKMVMEYRRFSSVSQFEAWEESQRQREQDYRSQPSR